MICRSSLWYKEIESKQGLWKVGVWDKKSCCFEKKVAVLKINRIFAVGEKVCKTIKFECHDAQNHIVIQSAI